MPEPSAHYTVLARRFRPQAFDEVIGQEHVAQALRNAIRAGRVAHAYLFTGARGVGKTSMARILAKALNCPDAVDGVPCNQCEICLSISSGSDVDVSEIDGASNRGIDDIRSLRASVNVKSMRTRYKVYIIDEVHMLTKEAFNALLKTLEEPPPNVKFVFCTTEPTRVPDTILSRCQRFDFAAIETANIVARLNEIAAAEGCRVHDAALELVARRAAGSMRDSQSLFDQLLAFGGETITVEDVHRLFGTAEDERLIAIAAALIDRRRDEALRQFDEALSQGVQLEELFDQLLNYVRDLMVIAAGSGGGSLWGVSAAHRSTLEQQAERWGLQTIVAAMEILAETRTRMFRATFGRALAELALVRISLLEELDRLEKLIDSLQRGDASPASLPSRQARSGQAEQPPAKGAAPAGTAAASKKNGGESPVAPPRVGNGPPAAPPPQVPFEPGCERELWAQVVSQITDMLKTHAQAVSDAAISGPNSLELVFPASYHFSAQYCRRPEVTSRLQQVIRRITGRDVTVRVELADTAASASRRASNREVGAPQTTKPSPVTADPQKDPFVQQALAVFGGTVVKVEALADPRDAAAQEDA